MNTYTFRLKPAQDLFLEIESFVKKQSIQAGCVLCGVGSLTQAVLRLANQNENSCYEGHFEIVSITGAVSTHGSHIHLAISDGEGRTLGGHLVPGCQVYTTAEIVLLAIPEVIYRRETCVESGYEELVVLPMREED